MKEMNLENQLRSWQPRQPAAGIKTRLFPKSERRRELVRAIRWLAPAAACGLIALAALHEQFPLQSLESINRPAGGPESGLAAGIAGVAVNRLPESFEWTNGSGSAFNVRSFLPGKTN